MFANSYFNNISKHLEAAIFTELPFTIYNSEFPLLRKDKRPFCLLQHCASQTSAPFEMFGPVSDDESSTWCSLVKTLHFVARKKDLPLASKLQNQVRVQWPQNLKLKLRTIPTECLVGLAAVDVLAKVVNVSTLLMCTQCACFDRPYQLIVR